MSEWDSDKQSEWGDKPVESEARGARGGLFGSRKPSMTTKKFRFSCSAISSQESSISHHHSSLPRSVNVARRDASLASSAPRSSRLHPADAGAVGAAGGGSAGLDAFWPGFSGSAECGFCSRRFFALRPFFLLRVGMATPLNAAEDGARAVRAFQWAENIAES